MTLWKFTKWFLTNKGVVVHAACVNIIPLLYKYLILGQSVQFIFMNNKIKVWGVYEKITQFYLAICISLWKFGLKSGLDLLRFCISFKISLVNLIGIFLALSNPFLRWWLVFHQDSGLEGKGGKGFFVRTMDTPDILVFLLNRLLA